MSREELEELAWRQREALRLLANRAGEDSTTSSRPPSSDDPYRRGERGKPAAADRDGGAALRRPAREGRQASEKKTAGPRQTARRERVLALPADRDERGSPARADRLRRLPGRARSRPEAPMRRRAQQPGTRPRRNVSPGHGEQAHLLRRALLLRPGQLARPGVGLRSDIEGRRRNLLMSERCLVGPMLATFIAALSLRFRMSRGKIREFLRDWLGLELGVATIERCIHEFGLASEPIVEQLIQDVRAADIVHIDETPWYQGGDLRWMWVATTAMTTVFRIASRRKEELTALIGDAFLGWLVTDGYVAYRDHPRRQRCLAHLIRKGLALAEGWYDAGSGFGRELVRDLRRLIERVHDGEGGETPAVKRLMARIQWNCQSNRHEVENKVRELAGEILNDWDAVVAFVDDPSLPPTNNDAERALRHAVIARRISSAREPTKAAGSTPRASA